MDEWCDERRIPRGEVIALDQCWQLSKEWYVDRLDPEWRQKTTDEMEAIFNRVGLVSPFWELS